MKALIKVGYGCNNHCTFCHTLDVRHVDGDAAEVERKIDRAAALGHTMVVLSGGEVTMRPELLKWAARSAALGLDFGLVTNGRALAYPELVERLLKLRLRYVYLSMHGGDAKIHNLLVRADAFAQTYAAVANLSGKGLDLWVNTVVTRQNLEHLRAVVDAMLPFPDAVLKFSMVAPKGGGEKHFDRLTPRVTDVAAKVVDAIEYGLARTSGSGPGFAHDGLPFCLLPGHEGRYDDLKTHAFRSMVEIGEPDFFPVDDLHKIQPPACDDCAERGPCPGLYRGYPEVHGVDELRPLRRRARSNSYHYAPEKVVGRLASASHEGCPIFCDGTTPWDRGRDLFVRKGGTIARFRTETRDFTDAEIARTKWALGQLYVDVSQKPAPDDFSRDLRPLRPSPICAPCPARDRCAGLFEPARFDLFARDDELVRARLAALEGDVLDLGCGEAPYADALAARVASGAIRYVGVDPSAAALEALRARLPGARLQVGVAEAIAAELPEASLDAALVLRSWNHLEAPAPVVLALARALRPGGQLIVVDNVAFGLVRTRAQAERAERGPAAFEHYRNDGAEQAARVLDATGLVPTYRRDVTPETSNQWVLVYAKPNA